MRILLFARNDLPQWLIEWWRLVDMSKFLHVVTSADNIVKARVMERFL